MKVLLILNGAPYGDERTYNGLRLAGALAKREDTTVRVFLMGDAVTSAKAGQHPPEGFYNCGNMLHLAGAEVALCGSCMDARGLSDKDMIQGARRGSLSELAAWTVDADKVLVF